MDFSNYSTFLLQALSESSKKEIDDSQQSENPNDAGIVGNQGASNLNKNREFDEDKQTRDGLTGTSEDESSYSSFYSSFLKTDSGSGSDRNANKENNDVCI